MDIPTNVLNEYLIPKDYVKPDVRVGNYFLEWNTSSYGIPQKEVSNLRRFIADLAPFLSTFIFEAALGIPRSIREKASSKEAHNFEEAFSPRLMIARKIRNSEYVLQMTADGAATLSRSETIAGDGKQADLALNWNLGQILFDRQR
ncbi:hypothetical protein [Candidatus Nitrososphaera gargensis]|uniref:hypothetical protein n=1 Tax=Candidatus Nitrososphaera gargensis TaxID=497727 RepID=UPI0011E50C65|nr:hypothetical protein [Candidatus Nitrososphaera gargensis]